MALKSFWKKYFLFHIMESNNFVLYEYAANYIKNENYMQLLPKSYNIRETSLAWTNKRLHIVRWEKQARAIGKKNNTFCIAVVCTRGCLRGGVCEEKLVRHWGINITLRMIEDTGTRNNWWNNNLSIICLFPSILPEGMQDLALDAVGVIQAAVAAVAASSAAGWRTGERTGIKTKVA